MHLDAWLPRAAAAHPERTAIETAAGGALSYARLQRRAECEAAALARAGVRAGDRVALALPAGAAFAGALHACWALGAIVVPIDLRLPADERAARRAGAVAVIDAPLGPGGGGEPGRVAGGALRRASARDRGRGEPAPGARRHDAAREPAPRARRHDAAATAAILHTSGTTAAARPVSLTHGNFLAAALGSAVALGLDPGERWLAPMPLCHVGGLSILVRSAIYGTTAVVHERFDAGAVARALREDRITLVSLVPTMLARLLEAGLDRRPPALRCILLGGGPAPAPLLARARDAGLPVAQTYGMTETCSQATTSLPGEPETAGAALPGTSVEIAPDGEILIAGPTVAPGALAPDRWLHTGDVGALDERGRLTVSGRKAETIISGGENVAPAAVEAVLLAHPAVADAGVHGVTDPQWGEAVHATIVLRDGDVAPGAEALRAHCAAALAPYEVPKRFTLADSLPRTPSGKLLRRALGPPPRDRDARPGDAGGAV